ncbi:MAG: type secretion system protein ImpB [Pyrinomonadaceae bacterium]|nr:type secretion system protein ImpB [Pyrinomonadaceae bacterium]
MPESTQHKLDRVRRPRVQITYDVETLGSIVKTELPFVVGIMADLSGNNIAGKDPDRPAALPMKDRKYVEIDRDNFDSIMEKIGPSVKLSAKSGFSDTLAFSKLEDFSPINVLRKVPDLKKKFDSRTRLSNLVAKLDGNVRLQEDFVKAFNDLMAQGDSATLDKYLLAMNPPPGMPSVTDAETTTGVQTASGLVITPATDAVGKKTTHFKISAITGGTLFKSDGKTPVATDAANAFITKEEGADGLRFMPDATATPATPGSFTVEASTDGKSVVSDTSATATITVSAVTSKSSDSLADTPAAPVVANVTTARAAKTAPISITPPPGATGTDVTHFKISKRTGGTLTKKDGKTAVADDAFITKKEGSDGLIFTPDPTATTNGSFTVEASTDGTTVATGIPSATATITVT